MASTELRVGPNSSELLLRAGTNAWHVESGPICLFHVPLIGRAAAAGKTIELLTVDASLYLLEEQRPILLGVGKIASATVSSSLDTHLLCEIRVDRQSAMRLTAPHSGRVTLRLRPSGLLRITGSESLGVSVPGQTSQSLETQSLYAIGGGDELEVQVARSDWYDQVVSQVSQRSLLVVDLDLPAKTASWAAAMQHLDEALHDLALGKAPEVFAQCRAAIDSLPGDKTGIFDAMDAGPRRDNVDDLTRSFGKYLHGGRHVADSSSPNEAGRFPVTLADATFAYNSTRLLLSHIARLTLPDGGSY